MRELRRCRGRIQIADERLMRKEDRFGNSSTCDRINRRRILRVTAPADPDECRDVSFSRFVGNPVAMSERNVALRYLVWRR